MKKNLETNYTSFESPTIEFFESGKKLGVASSWGWPRPSKWKINTFFTLAQLESLMIELLSILKLFSSTTIQGFLLRYKPLTYIIWHKNGTLCKFYKNIGIWLVKHFDLYVCLKLVYTWTSGLPGQIASGHFWQVFPHKEFQKMIVITFKHLWKLSYFPKFQGCGSKNEPSRPIFNFKLNCL